MKRLGLVLILLPAFACDVKEKSIGDSGNAGESNDDGGEGGEGSDSGSDGGDELQGCTLIGCDDGLFLTLRQELPIAVCDPWPDGNYQIQLYDADSGSLHFACDFAVVEKQVEDPDCIVTKISQQHGCNDDIQVLLPLGVANARIDWRIDGGLVASRVEAPDYQDLYPNGVECDPACTQGRVMLTMGANLCEDLEAAFLAEVELVRGCTDASECGQVIDGTSCGCTRDWVARNDADLTRFQELVDLGGHCDWASFESTCDCPETDGYACVDEICTWNYL